MVERIDHLGIAVKDLREALKVWSGALGLDLTGTEVVESDGVRVAFLQIGESRIELLEATTESSPVAKFIARRGEGIHHLCLQVSDIELAAARLREHGLRTIDSAPRPGAHGARVMFVHPAATGGVLLELSQHE
jgi:methylmalonyl-CoA/ethylmalonyl-CoA epimerase